MADKSKIEWTDATWNPITGCSVVSPGCTNCYAMRLAGTRMKHEPSREGLTTMTKAGPVWAGEVRFNEQWLDQPLRWRRSRRIFVVAHGDLFHENVPDHWIDRVFAVMALAPQHTFQVLTKRPARMRRYLAAPIGGTTRYDWIFAAVGRQTGRSRVKSFDFPLPNVWLGVSAEDQTRADERIPVLLDTPAAVRFVSLEPLLGPVDLTECPRDDALLGYAPDDDGDTHKLDWVIAGGESGPGARPMHPDWVRFLRDQCQAAGVAFHFKQWGSWRWGSRTSNGWYFYPGPTGGDDQSGDPGSIFTPNSPDHDWGGGHVSAISSKKAAGRVLDGRTWDEMPGQS